MVKDPGNGRLNNLNDPVLNVLKYDGVNRGSPKRQFDRIFVPTIRTGRAESYRVIQKSHFLLYSSRPHQGMIDILMVLSSSKDSPLIIPKSTGIRVQLIFLNYFDTKHGFLFQ